MIEIPDSDHLFSLKLKSLRVNHYLKKYIAYAYLVIVLKTGQSMVCGISRLKFNFLIFSKITDMWKKLK